MSCDLKLVNRLKRSEGQIRGILGMIEKGTSCQEVITQLSAVRSSIDKVMAIMVSENLLQAIEKKTDSNLHQDNNIQEALELIIKTR